VTEFITPVGATALYLTANFKLLGNKIVSLGEILNVNLV